MPGIRNFASAKEYSKWLAYGNIHHLFKHEGKGYDIHIAGKHHKVDH